VLINYKKTISIMKTKHMIIAASCMLCSSAAFSQVTTIVTGMGGATVKGGTVSLCPIPDERTCGVIVMQTPGIIENGSGNPVIVRDNDGKSFEGVLIGPMPEDGVQGRDLVIRGGRRM
jgi:hypothetical protein